MSPNDGNEMTVDVAAAVLAAGLDFSRGALSHVMIRFARAFTIAILAIFVTGCSPRPDSGARVAAARTDRLVIGQGREFNSLLPFMNNGYTTSELIGLSFSLLVTLDASGSVPDAAVIVPTVANGGISPDGRTITYHLRPGMRWQDGQSLTARDVLFTYAFAMNPNSPLPYRDGFDRVAAIAAPDPLTVVVRLRHPNRAFITDFLGPESATPILPAHLLAGVTDVAHSAYARAPIGSGPYRIGRWQRGDAVRFDASSTWYGGRAAIAHVLIRFIPDVSTRLTQLRTHEIDAELGAAASTAVQLRGAPGIRLDAETGPIFTQLSFRFADPIGGASAIRFAIAQAIDARTIARSVSQGLLDGRDGGRALYDWAYDPRAGYPTYDPGAARRRLEAAGWRRGPDGVRRNAAGLRLAFTISLRADRADDNAAAIQVQQQLRELGIDVALKTYSAPQFTANDGVLRAGRFSVELSQYYPNIEPDPTIFFACADRGLGGFNISGYCDPVADRDMDAALATFDRPRVRFLLSRAQRRINTALPMIFLWQGTDLNLVPSRLRHFSDLRGKPFSNAGHWSLSP